MADNKSTTTKKESSTDEASKSSGRPFYFPRAGKTIYAKNRAEAEKQLKSDQKEAK